MTSTITSTIHSLTQAFADYGERGPKWSGGDSTASVALPNNRTAWLFSDTMIGGVLPDHSRTTDSAMVHNSLVMSYDSEPRAFATTYGGTYLKPESLIVTQSGEYCWIGSGLLRGTSIYVIVNRYRTTGPGQFDFEFLGSALAELDALVPRPTVAGRLPFGNFVQWGSAIVERAGQSFVFGSAIDPATGRRHAYLARATRLDEPETWRFWVGGWWSRSWEEAEPVTSDVGTAFGVQRHAGRWVMVTVDCSDPFSSDVVMRESEALYGPWSAPRYLFTAPEPVENPDRFVYDARVHPHLAAPGELLVSYNVNSTDQAVLFGDARVYRPRFVSVGGLA